MEEDNKKPYKIKDITRAIKKAVVAGTLDEVRSKAAEKFGRTELPNIHLDSDGTEVDDEDYFQTLEPNAELIVVFPGEQWIDPTHYVTITTHKESSSGDTTDSPEVERIHLKKLVAQMKSNLCNVSVLSEPDLELLSNMDPNSVADITGRDFIEQLKEASGRILHEKRQALDAIELLKLIAKQKASIPSVVHNIPGGDPDENGGGVDQQDTDDDETSSCYVVDEEGIERRIGCGVRNSATADDIDGNSMMTTAGSGQQITLELDPRTLATIQSQQHQQSRSASTNNPADLENASGRAETSNI